MMGCDKHRGVIGTGEGSWGGVVERDASVGPRRSKHRKEKMGQSSRERMLWIRQRGSGRSHSRLGMPNLSTVSFQRGSTVAQATGRLNISPSGAHRPPCAVLPSGTVSAGRYLAVPPPSGSPACHRDIDCIAPEPSAGSTPRATRKSTGGFVLDFKSSGSSGPVIKFDTRLEEVSKERKFWIQ